MMLYHIEGTEEICSCDGQTRTGYLPGYYLPVLPDDKRTDKCCASSERCMLAELWRWLQPEPGTPMVSTLPDTGNSQLAYNVKKHQRLIFYVFSCIIRSGELLTNLRLGSWLYQSSVITFMHDPHSSAGCALPAVPVGLYL
jgi:hypothetical protein